MSINGPKSDLFLLRHNISHLLQSFRGQKLRYEFEIWHANYSHVCSIHIVRFCENFENFGF